VKTNRRSTSSTTSTTTQDAVYLLLLSGDADRAYSILEAKYPENQKVVLTKEQLRAGDRIGQLQAFRQVRGQAFVLFAESIERIWEPQVKRTVALAHRCQVTAFADEAGRFQAFRRRDVVPQLIWSGVLDALTLAGAGVARRIVARWLLSGSRPRPEDRADLDVLHLYPFPFQRLRPGGELSYLKGTLSGLSAESVRGEIVSGCPILDVAFPVHVVPNVRRFYLFKESQALSYNCRFILAARRVLGDRRPRIIYQRHGKFVAAGAVLARLLDVPLALEYQNPEYWWAKTWRGSRFLRLLARIEDLVVASASIIVVVSNALREELIEKGVAADRIIVNPAAVSPERFRPSEKGRRTREELGFVSDEVVVAFVGSFYQWHGIEVLGKAIGHLAEREREGSVAHRLRFLLVGDGPLRGDLELALREVNASNNVTFTGTAAADRVPALMDAADILVAPTVPMPGKPFLGSPSKLFEYMAMGKAIVASDLDQLGDILEHKETAWLVPPTDHVRLAEAIEFLAENREVRLHLGRNARAAVLQRYTWHHNAERLLGAVERLHGTSHGDTPPRLVTRQHSRERDQFASW
jgi:glycosyltransferase involved in cell wall biosynthesis